MRRRHQVQMNKRDELGIQKMHVRIGYEEDKEIQTHRPLRRKNNGTFLHSSTISTSGIVSMTMAIIRNIASVSITANTVADELFELEASERFGPGGGDCSLLFN